MNTYKSLQLFKNSCYFLHFFLQILANSLQIDVQVACLRILVNSYKFLQTLKESLNFYISYNFFHIFAKSYKLLLIHKKLCNFFLHFSYKFL